MVAKITTPQNVRRALNYNEQKVQQGKAKCLHAGNFLKDAHQMNFQEKLRGFQKNIELSKAKTSTLHISLNFDSSDKIDSEKMLQIANDYMQRIGFGNQPYLVYEHHDAGHKHCHIVTTNIKSDGKRIDTYNIGKKISEPARKAIEIEYGLARASGRKQQHLQIFEEPQKVEYGKVETKKSITTVLQAVIDHYKYSSLAELNAVLRLYNVEADRGKEGSRTYNKRGLYYRIIDHHGNKIGVPIKASSIYSKPTLDNLEKKFTANEVGKQIGKPLLKTSIDWVLTQQPESLREFVNRLSLEKISIVIRSSSNGQVYGLTYVDHRSKVVFNGSDLGKSYSAKGIQEKLNLEQTKALSEEKLNERTGTDRRQNERTFGKNLGKDLPLKNDEHYYHGRSAEPAASAMLQHLLKPERGGDPMARELLDDEKRKKRKYLDHDQEHEI